MKAAIIGTGYAGLPAGAGLASLGLAIKSTVPVGTGDRVEELIRRSNPTAQTEDISLPKSLREGYTVHEFPSSARIVVGTESAAAHAYIRERIARRVLEAVKGIPHPRIAVPIEHILREGGAA